MGLVEEGIVIETLSGPLVKIFYLSFVELQYVSQAALPCPYSLISQQSLNVSHFQKPLVGLTFRKRTMFLSYC